MIYITIKGKGTGIRATLNDVLVYDNSGDYHDHQSVVSMWLTSGKNTLKVHTLNSEEKPKIIGAVMKLLPDESSELMVSYGSEGLENPNESGVALEGLIPERWSEVIDFDVDSSDCVSTQPWLSTRAKVTRKDEIYKVYKEIHKAFTEKNLSALMSLAVVRNQLSSEAYDEDPMQFKKAVEEDFRVFLNEGRLKPIVNDLQNVTLVELLEGKVFRVEMLAAANPICTEADDDGFQTGYDVVLGITDEGVKWIL